jgi:hypothetical protein
MAAFTPVSGHHSSINFLVVKSAKFCNILANHPNQNLRLTGKWGSICGTYHQRLKIKRGNQEIIHLTRFSGKMKDFTFSDYFYLEKNYQFLYQNQTEQENFYHLIKCN